MSKPGGTESLPLENEECEPELPRSTRYLLRPRRQFLAGVVTLLIVLGIVFSLVTIGIGRFRQVDLKPSEEVSAPVIQPDIPVSVPPRISESLVLDATKSYLSSTSPNTQITTEAEKLRFCLFVEDGYKERLDCYDKIFPPDPKPKPPIAKQIADCRLLKEEDQRLACFNRFMAPPPKPAQKASTKTSLPK